LFFFLGYDIGCFTALWHTLPFVRFRR